MAWRPEIRAVGEKTFSRNSLVFETEQEALASAENTFLKWFGAKEFRAVETDEVVNYRWDKEQKNVLLKEKE